MSGAPKWPHDHSAKHRAAALKGWARRRQGTSRESRTELQPRALPHRTPGGVLDVNYPLVLEMRHLYGADQLGASLQSFSPSRLQEAAKEVHVRPGRTKAVTVARILDKYGPQAAPSRQRKRKGGERR